MHEISLLCIPIQRIFCKPNPKTGSRDYKFLNPGFRDWEFNRGIAITRRVWHCVGFY